MISVPANFPAYDVHTMGEVNVASLNSTVNTESSSPVPNLTTIDEPAVISPSSKFNQNQSEIPDPFEWTPKLEEKFKRLAQSKSFDELSLKGNVEFERLAAFRRQLKNPRTGEEIIAEYEQRLITRNLVDALAQYVEWHKQYSTNNSR